MQTPPLTDVTTLKVCRKCGKSARETRIERHHKGCEFMWVRHFAGKHRTARYIEFKARYEAFRDEDVVLLCGGDDKTSCHKHIHRIYKRIINKKFSTDGRRARDWSWDEAEKLMQTLRKRCDQWLETK